MNKYKIITSRSPHNLELKVNKYKDVGYVIVGGLVYANGTWAQAVEYTSKKDKYNE